MPPFPSDLPFYALLQYSVRGQSRVSLNSRDVRLAIKTDGVLGGVRVIQLAAQRTAENLATSGVLAPCFADRPVLVPMPRSAPMKVGALWPAAEICQALVAQGVGCGVMRCLRRVKPIQKAAWAGPGERPDPPDHCESMTIEGADLLSVPDAIVVVDDLVTRGSSFIGTAPLVADAFPGVPVRWFALMRTISDGEVSIILAPVAGRVSYLHGRLHREP